MESFLAHGSSVSGVRARADIPGIRILRTVADLDRSYRRPMTTTENRPAALHSYFAYRDAPAALRWLERAFGFETTLEFPDDNGGIMHSELRRGDAAIMVFSDDGNYDRPALRGRDRRARHVSQRRHRQRSRRGLRHRRRGRCHLGLGTREHPMGQLSLPGPRPRGLRVDVRHPTPGREQR